MSRAFAALLLHCLALQASADVAPTSVDVSIRLSVPEAPRLSSRMTYRITVSNAGPDTATGVVVTNQVPAELTDTWATVSQGSFAWSNRWLRWEADALPAGDAATVWVEATPRSENGYAPGWVSVEAGVNSLELDTQPENNFASAPMRLGGPDVAAFLQPPTNQVRAGVSFPLLVTVTNLGPGTAEYVTLYSNPGLGEFLCIDFVLSRGSAYEVREGGVPWRTELGAIPQNGYATLLLTLVPIRGGELSFVGSVQSGSSDEDEDDDVVVRIYPADGPGIIQFASAAQSVRENAGPALVQIQRLYGTLGTVSVWLATEDGSDHAGREYVATNGLLVFNEGEAAKTVPISILNNDEPNCNGTLLLRLSQPAGGAFLWGQTNLNLTIFDDDVVPVGELTAASLSTNGLDVGNGDTLWASLSGDGRWLAFTSAADDLVPNDTNGWPDIFLKDLQSGAIQLVSKSRFGDHGADGFSYLPMLSADGRRLVFNSLATDLVTNSLPPPPYNRQIFAQDLLTGITRLVTVTPQGTGADLGAALGGHYITMGISSNGQIVAFLNGGTNLANGKPQLFVRNLETEQTTLVTRTWDGTGPCNGETYAASLSADGRIIVFGCSATDLVLGGPSIGGEVIYVRDLTTATNLPITGGWSPVVSADGRYAAFLTIVEDPLPWDNINDDDVLVRDLVTGVTHWANAGLRGPCDTPSLSADGRFVAFRSGYHPGNLPTDPWRPDSNGSQVYVYDCRSNTTVLVSVNCRGDGPGNVHARNPVISANGRYVFFQSSATDLVPGAFDNTVPNLYCRDLVRQVTFLVSQDRAGTGGAKDPFGGYIDGVEFSLPVLSADGTVAAFTSSGDDLAWGDGNGYFDVFLWRLDRPSRRGPELRIDREGAELVVRWPSGATNYLLQVTDNLTAWAILPGVGTNRAFRLQPADRAFFRLESIQPR